MGVVPVRIVPLNQLISAWTLLVAKMHGLRARVPPLLGWERQGMCRMIGFELRIVAYYVPTSVKGEYHGTETRTS